MKKGQWMCRFCSRVNSAKYSACYNCGKPRSEAEQKEEYLPMISPLMLSSFIKEIGDKVVERYPILTTALLAYIALEPEPAGVMGSHSSITYIEGKPYGRIGTRRLPPELERLPPGTERVTQVREWQETQYNEAYDLIIKAFPEAKAGKRGMGEIIVDTASRQELTKDPYK